MKKLFLLLVFSLWSVTASAADMFYEGSWNTVKNRKLDGTMKCDVTSVGKEKWEGRFYGVWQGVSFEYKINFSGHESNLRGTATIDGASYEWKGQMAQESPGWFKGTFTGSRYDGSFDLQGIRKQQ